jgi:hypothetical protein
MEYGLPFIFYFAIELTYASTFPSSVMNFNYDFCSSGVKTFCTLGGVTINTPAMKHDLSPKFSNSENTLLVGPITLNPRFDSTAT